MISEKLYMHPGDSATHLGLCNPRSLSGARRADMTDLVASKLRLGSYVGAHPVQVSRVDRDDQDNYTESIP